MSRVAPYFIKNRRCKGIMLLKNSSTNATCYSCSGSRSVFLVSFEILSSQSQLFEWAKFWAKQLETLLTTSTVISPEWIRSGSTHGATVNTNTVRGLKVNLKQKKGQCDIDMNYYDSFIKKIKCIFVRSAKLFQSSSKLIVQLIKLILTSQGAHAKVIIRVKFFESFEWNPLIASQLKTFLSPMFIKLLSS